VQDGAGPGGQLHGEHAEQYAKGQRGERGGEHPLHGGGQDASEGAAALGEPVRWPSVPFDVFRSLDIPVAEEMGNMFQYYSDFDQEFTGARDLIRLRELNPALRSFDDWLADNASKIQVG